MRVLLRDKRDDTMTVVEAVEVNYDPLDKALCVCLCDSDSYIVENITSDDAQAVVIDLYQKGMASTTRWAARYDNGCGEDTEV